MTVILIAALGFVNYVLWKIYGPRGIDITSFLGLIADAILRPPAHALAEFTAAGNYFVARASQQFGANGAHGLSKHFLRLEKL